MNVEQLSADIALAKAGLEDALVALEAGEAALTGDAKPLADIIRKGEGLMHMPALIQPLIDLGLSDAVLLPALEQLVHGLLAELGKAATPAAPPTDPVTPPATYG